MSLRNPVPKATGTYFLAVTNSPADNASLVLRGITVSSTYGTARWLLAFAGSEVPIDGTVPIMPPIYVAANAVNVSLELPDQGLKVSAPGIVLVASSTADDLTKDTSATWEIGAFVEDWEVQSRDLADETTAGDLTTGRNTLQVWAESNVPHALKTVKINNLTSEVRYAVVYAVDAPDANSKIITWFPLAADESAEFCLGLQGGLSPLQIDADGTKHEGCTIECQETLVPGDQAAGNDFTIQAVFK